MLENKYSVKFHVFKKYFLIDSLSTLFMLICAFVGYENAFRLYNHAIEKQYRFYSYGDSSLLFKKIQ